MTLVFHQGNRVKESCCDEAYEKIVIPRGDLAAETQGILARGSSQQVVRHVLDGREVGGGVIGSHPAFIIAEDHVHDPVQAILHCPMASDDQAELGRQKHQ